MGSGKLFLDHSGEYFSATKFWSPPSKLYENGVECSNFNPFIGDEYSLGLSIGCVEFMAANKGKRPSRKQLLNFINATTKQAKEYWCREESLSDMLKSLMRKGSYDWLSNNKEVQERIQKLKQEEMNY